jgi:pyruvate-ferredoxin/flavodoxin oxidoreductase
MQPRVEAFVGELDELIGALDRKARELLSADADLDLAAAAEGEAPVPLDEAKREELGGLVAAKNALEDLRWRYVEGPGGKGRANLGISNSTGCSSVWASTYPYNAYPYPWVNHLFQDAPSVAIGLFEGHMRKMADGFRHVRRARLLASDEYDAATHEPELAVLDWQEFTDTEFDLCPPITAIGGDGAMLDIGFQNLSRLLASGKPIRVIVLDTQVYSNTGGQACTSGFTGQVSDMAAYGKAQHGKEEVRKELSLIAIAHRGAFVLQSSQASASHMIGGVIRGLQTPRPTVFNIYTPCPVEHGLADEMAPNAARFALESRAFPFLIYDPDQGPTIADCLDLSGNPSLEDAWPLYDLEYLDDEGAEQTLELPVTTADWAATEGRFKKHFRTIRRDDWDDDAQVLFHEFVAMSEDERVGKTPFVWTINEGRKLNRLASSMEIVTLAEDRLLFWAQLKELAGLQVPASVRESIASEMEEEFEARVAELRAEYEQTINELKTSVPPLVARRLAEGLLRSGTGKLTVSELLGRARVEPGLQPVTADSIAGAASMIGDGAATAPAVSPAPAIVQPVTDVEEAPVEVETAVEAAEPDDDDDLIMEPYIETARCTSCDECININKKMFAYNDAKQAYIKDSNAGTFAEIVQAAEKCTAEIIHPGTPLNPKEKNLEKWIERAKPFN